MINIKYKPSLTRLLSLVFALALVFTLTIRASAENGSRTLYLGGFPFGIKMDSDGVFVTDVTEVDSTIGRVSPAKDADIRVGDIILSINGKSTDTIEEASSLISSSKGKRITLEIERGGNKITKNLIPVLTSDKSGYKSGLFIRDDTVGIGTVTFLEDDKMTLGGLGHGILDRSTMRLLSLKSGKIHRAIIDSVVKGTDAAPGELKGNLSEEPWGELTGNTEMGVFGKLYGEPSHLQKIEMGLSDEVRAGKCKIYTCLEGESAEAFDGEIVKIIDKKSDTKNFIVRLTDERALEKTGGIVQGMSGSPIVQNGKLVGAVTHVLMRDQTEGYGIFVENMLSEAEKLK